ncbi:heme/hemin ABC transporter substrate-binding protein [Thiosocius teredinicola]|uniref:heme/hemin ABC transporter substrate-binding protein n=1 Tax=Thiosocius teredinicola TaxID=1973002 RepID=UPI0009910C8A
MFRLGYSTLVVGVLLALLLSNVRAVAQQQERRIVVVGGALTEIVYALGEQADVVGVDTTSQWPSATKALPNVGYQRALSAEGVASLTPSLMLVSDDAGPPGVLQRLRESGMRIETVAYKDTEDGLVRKVLHVSRVLGVPQRGAQLAGELARLMDLQAERVATFSSRPRAAFLLSVGKGNHLATGTDTTADAFIRLAGGVNALGGYSGYKPVNAEAMIEAAPEVLLTTADSLEQVGGVDGLLALPGVAATPAGRSRRIIALDGLYLLGFGPRTPQALAELTDRLHAHRVADSRVDTP